MATKKQRERKRKAREDRGRARAASRRHKLQEMRREERRKSLLDRRFREKQSPIVKDPDKKRLMDEAEKNKVLERLQRNADILKALEEEYERDTAQKKAVNDSLEAEGHHTLQEKVRALEEKARASADDEGKVDMTPAPELS